MLGISLVFCIHLWLSLKLSERRQREKSLLINKPITTWKPTSAWGEHISGGRRLCTLVCLGARVGVWESSAWELERFPALFFFFFPLTDDSFTSCGCLCFLHATKCRALSFQTMLSVIYNSLGFFFNFPFFFPTFLAVLCISGWALPGFTRVRGRNGGRDVWWVQSAVNEGRERNIKTCVFLSHVCTCTPLYFLWVGVQRTR